LAGQNNVVFLVWKYCRTAPATELAVLYQERWEIEFSLDFRNQPTKGLSGYPAVPASPAGTASRSPLKSMRKRPAKPRLQGAGFLI
jgi:hypothetical protein